MTADTRPFSWPQMIAGLLLSLVVGCIANVFFVMFGIATKSAVLAALTGLIAGAAFALLAWVLKKSVRSFSIGLFIGACLVALCGGLCGGLIVAGGGLRIGG
jgi:hypothetical protein